MNKIAERRKMKGYSQTELADLVEVSQSLIAAYENETRPPTDEMLVKIARKLDCRVRDLKNGEDEEATQ